MLLEGKNAVVYGASGSIGCRVSTCFAREGARVHLCGRSASALEKVAQQLVAEGGSAYTHALDASSIDAVSEHLDRVQREHGTVDISFNLIGVQDSQGMPLVEMSLEAFERPIAVGTTAHFATATEAAKRMLLQGKGVIMALTATPARLALPLVGGFGSYCAAIEGFYRTLAAEVGASGVRVCWLRSAGSPETFVADVASDQLGKAAGISDDDYLMELQNATLLQRFPRADEVAETATLIASDRAAAMTAAAINVTCGQIAD